ncbi:MAG: SAM-dependent methyltransferase [Thermoplasmata archaeon]|nr:SAM-dependent methyltransferase [Thermoplasmata archaeon]
MSPEPADEEARRLVAVDAALRQAAGADGFLRFDRFVEIALYAPGIGYYSHAGRQIGASGDFYTAAQVGPLLGATLARRVAQEYDRLGRPASFRIVEVGAGDGSLAEALVGALARQGTFGSSPVDYVLVEPSPSLATRLSERLAASHRPPGLEWRVAPSLSSDGPFAGIVVANELLDALPFRRLLAVDGAWREQGVSRGASGWTWAEGRAPNPFPPPALPAPAPPGSVWELSVLAEGLMRELGDHLVRGAAIFLDYGDDGAALRHRFPRGSLTAFRAHEVLENPLDLPGSADLSMFVDFTRIRAAAIRSGLTELSYRIQSESLAGWGLGEVGAEWIAEATGSVEQVRRRLALKNLAFGFPNFRALELSAGA